MPNILRRYNSCFCRILIVCMTAVLFSCSATAPKLSDNWVRLAENYIAVFYINPDTIDINGDFRRVWEIQDLKEPDSAGEMSRLAQTEYDCTNRRIRVLIYIEHDKPMAKGAVLYSRKPFIKKWLTIPTGTPTHDVMKEVCSS